MGIRNLRMAGEASGAGGEVGIEWPQREKVLELHELMTMVRLLKGCWYIVYLLKVPHCQCLLSFTKDQGNLLLNPRSNNHQKTV